MANESGVRCADYYRIRAVMEIPLRCNRASSRRRRGRSIAVTCVVAPARSAIDSRQHGRRMHVHRAHRNGDRSQSPCSSGPAPARGRPPAVAAKARSTRRPGTRPEHRDAELCKSRRGPRLLLQPGGQREGAGERHPRVGGDSGGWSSLVVLETGAGSRIRTDDLRFTKPLHYHCAMPARSRRHDCRTTLGAQEKASLSAKWPERRPPPWRYTTTTLAVRRARR